MAQEDAVVLEHISKVYELGSGGLVVFEDFSQRFRAGELAVILGPSGCGKTTLLRLIAGLEEPTFGVIRFLKPRCRVGMVFQEYTAFPWLTVKKNIEFGLRHTDLSRDKFERVVDYWLDRVGLRDFRDTYPAELSGGMRQRLAIARCLAPNPSVVLLDEPFGSLDAITRLQIGTFTKDLLLDLGVTVIMVTHSVREAVRLGDRIVLLSRRPSRALRDLVLNDNLDHLQLQTQLETTIEESLT